MKITDIKHINIGDNGVVINEILFSEVIKKDFIDYLGQNGHLQYHNPPVYKIKFNKDFILRGIEGTNTARIYFYDNISDNLMKIKNIIHNYKDNSFTI